MKVAILGGGPSSEYEVSLNSAAKVKDHLSPERYDILSITVDKLGGWHIAGQKIRQAEGLRRLADWADVVFIAMHGEFGEDGTIQRLLERAGVAYTGSDSTSSALAMDKSRSRIRFAQAGLPIASGLVITKKRWEDGRIPNVKVPVVVKPAGCGSSVGVSIVTDPDRLKHALELAFNRDDEVLIEEFVGGREVTCGVLDDGKPQALPPTEIKPVDGDFYDYEAKYKPGASEHVTPAKLPADTISKIQTMAVKAHQALGCYGMSRTDFIVDDGRIVILETNTIPGMTNTSLLPEAAAAAGFSFPQLLDYIIEAALKRK